MIRAIDNATEYPYGFQSRSFLDVFLGAVSDAAASPRAAVQWCYDNRTWVFDGWGTRLVDALVILGFSWCFGRRLKQ
jgi:hypothetical protein